MSACPASDSTAAGLELGLQEVQQVVLAELGQAAGSKLLWTFTPLEYLARRRGAQAPLDVGQNLPVSALLPHIPFILEYCQKLVADSSSPATAQEAARKAASFTARLLSILEAPSLQQRLAGGQQHLRPCITMLQAALPGFQQQAAAGGAAGGASRASSSAAAAQQALLQPAGASPFASGPTAAAAAAAAGGPAPAGGSGSSSSSSSKASKGMDLAALLAAIAPFCDAQPGAPFPPGFAALLRQWAWLVYGQAGAADLRSVQVSALLLYHWRTLLRFLRLCLQGAAALDDRGSSSSGSSSTAAPMPVGTASGYIQGLLQLLGQQAIKAQFTAEQYARVHSRFLAFKAVLQGLPVTPSGHAAAVGSFSSSAVAAVMDAVQAVCNSGLAPAGNPANPSPAQQLAAPAPASYPLTCKPMSPGAPGSAHSSELTMSQQQLLSLVRSSLGQAGMLNAQQLDAVQEVLGVLRRQVVGSGAYETTLLPE